jgi:hypothetical protein
MTELLHSIIREPEGMQAAGEVGRQLCPGFA